MAANVDGSDSCRHNIIALQEVFKHLDWKDLRSAEMVCREWGKAVNEIRPTFGPAQTFFGTLHPETKEFELHMNRTSVLEPQFTLCFNNRGRRCEPLKCSQFSGHFRQRHCVTESSGQEVRICSGNHRMVETLDVWNMHRARPKSRIPRHIMCDIPTDQILYQTPSRKIDNYVMGGFSIPKIKHVDVHHQIHYIMPKNPKNSTSNEDNFAKLLNKFSKLTESNVIKCCLVFTNRSFRISRVNEFFEHLKERQEEPFAGGACYIKKQNNKLLSIPRDKLNIVTFTVSKENYHSVDFDCHSVLVNYTAEHRVSRKIERVAKLIPKRQHSLAIINHYLPDVDIVTIFSKYFPTTPVVGYKSYTPKCVEHLPKDDCDTYETKSKKPKTEFKTHEHHCIYYCLSFIVIFSWGKLI